MNNKRSLIWLLSVVMILVLGAGATLAYIHMSTQNVTNTFEPTNVSCDVEEEFADNVKRNVKIKNTSNIEAFIRSEIIVTWKNEAGEIYGKLPVKNIDYIMNLNLAEEDEEGWKAGKDGFYYFTLAKAPGAATDNLIDSCYLKEGASAPDGYYLSVEIIASAIQAEGESFGASTGEKGKKPAEIAWSNDIVTVTVATDEGGNKILSVSPLAE